MNVTLVGYGNANTQGGKTQCQHGPQECQALEWEDCAIKHYPDFNDHWPFILCMENKGDNMLHGVKSCAKKAKMTYSTLSTCYNGKEGKAALEAAGRRTGSHQYVPWVSVNGQHNTKAENDLLSTVCSLIEGDKPAGCNNQFEPRAAPEPCDNNGATIMKLAI
jgi:interferon gamma-inducible protein 30